MSFFVAYVKSFQRTGGTASNFSYVLNIPVQNSYDSVCMLQASIPKSFYIIANGRNLFQLTEGLSTVTISITPGNYSRRVFGATIQTLLNAASPNGYTYQVSIPNAALGADNGKYLFTVTNPSLSPLVSPILFSLPESSSPALQMGFTRGSENTFSVSVNPHTATLESSTITVFQSTSMIYVSCDVVNNNGTEILQDINSTTPDFSELIFQVGDSGGIHANVKQLKETWTNTIRILLTNVYDEIIDLNGLEWTCSLLFWDSSQVNDYQVQHKQQMMNGDIFYEQ